MSKMKWKIVFVVMLTLLVSLPLTAQAGTLTTTNLKYAIEGVTSTSTVTLSPVYYTLGVARQSQQNFTIIYTLPSGVLWNATPPVPYFTGAGAGAGASAAVKRGGANSNLIAYDISVGSAMVAGTTVLGLTSAAGTPLVIKNTGLTTSGNTVTVVVDVWDAGETARIDNSTSLSATIATASQGSNFWNSNSGAAGVYADTHTITDVGATVPLAGFLANASNALNFSDSATVSRAGVQLLTSPGATYNAAYDATGNAYWQGVAGDIVTVTVTDSTSFSGLATNGMLYAGSAIFYGSGTTKSFTVAGNHALSNANQYIGYTCDATTPLGTSRTLQIAGGLTASAGTSSTWSGSTTWWTWSSNGTQLFAPLFQTTTGFISRFVLTNTGSSAATFTLRVYAETGNTPTLGTTSGSIPATGMTVLDANTVVTGWTTGQAPRGQCVFTINAPSANVQGLYQIVSSSTGALSNYVMKRPASN